MKQQRQTAIKDLLAKAAASNGATAINNQDELRRKLAARGIRVTQATLSRDIRELKLLKGPAGYELPPNAEEEEALPEIGTVLQDFGLEVRQAQNLLIVLTTVGGAQPVAASLDYEEWSEDAATGWAPPTVVRTMSRFCAWRTSSPKSWSTVPISGRSSSSSALGGSS